MNAAIIEPAPAKLNLFLHITGKRPDGYHLLDSMVVFTEFGDTLEIHPADDVTLDITGPFAAGLTPDNSVMKAATLLQKQSGGKKGARMVLHKRIPVAAGLGGGSADAAAALRGLSKLWNISLPQNTLNALALSLGSDVPVCLTGEPALMRGVGEEIHSLPLTAKAWVVMANPLLPLETADVFRNFKGEFTALCDMPPRIASFDALQKFIAPTHNALEKTSIRLMPQIADMLGWLRSLNDCRLARMAGSGATCFALFDDAAKSEAALKKIRADFPRWWAVATAIKKTPSS